MRSGETIKEILSRTCSELKAGKIPSYRMDAEILIGHVLNMERTDLFVNFNRAVKRERISQIEHAAFRRMQYEPVAYITGTREFYGIDFIINRNTLIPRPETELLVEEILNCDPGIIINNKKILDIGAGCGNIGITIKKYAPSSAVTCCDISSDALNVALQNSRMLPAGDNIEFIQSDIYSNISQRYDIIVSNPPYIPEKEICLLQEDVKDHEPIIALNGGDDGLIFYKRIISEVQEYLIPGGYLFLEINPILKKPILKLLHDNGLGNVKVRKDYNGLDRIISGKNEN